MRSENNAVNKGKGMLYFLVSDKYLGDKRTAYGQDFSVTMSMTIPQPMCSVLVNVTSNSTTNATASITQVTKMEPCNDTQLIPSNLAGDVILKSAHQTYTLVTTLPKLPGTNKTQYKVCSVSHTYMSDIYM